EGGSPPESQRQTAKGTSSSSKGYAKGSKSNEEGRHQGHREEHVGNKEAIRLIVEKNTAYIFLKPNTVSGNGER
ncbi:MAG: hypothetical protein MI684_11560, partial [Chlorobiales bacterium]|nr:hypothetical protein [Chlorobiales bacterium]